MMPPDCSTSTAFSKCNRSSFDLPGDFFGIAYFDIVSVEHRVGDFSDVEGNVTDVLVGYVAVLRRMLRLARARARHLLRLRLLGVVGEAQRRLRLGRDDHRLPLSLTRHVRRSPVVRRLDRVFEPLLIGHNRQGDELQDANELANDVTKIGICCSGH